MGRESDGKDGDNRDDEGVTLSETNHRGFGDLNDLTKNRFENDSPLLKGLHTSVNVMMEYKVVLTMI